MTESAPLGMLETELGPLWAHLGQAVAIAADKTCASPDLDIWNSTNPPGRLGVQTALPSRAALAGVQEVELRI